MIKVLRVSKLLKSLPWAENQWDMFLIAKHLTLQFLVAKIYGLVLSYMKWDFFFNMPKFCPLPLTAGLSTLEPSWFQPTQWDKGACWAMPVADQPHCSSACTLKLSFLFCSLIQKDHSRGQKQEGDEKSTWVHDIFLCKPILNLTVEIKKNPIKV